MKSDGEDKPSNGIQVIIFRTVLKDFADAEDESSFDAESSFKKARHEVKQTATNAHKGADLVASIRKLANEHRDELTKVIQSNDWNQLAQLLTKLSSSSTLSSIKWSSLISDENKNTKQRDSIRRIFTSWASDDSESSTLNVSGIAKSASNNGKGGKEAVEKLRGILTENKDVIIKFVQSDDWESIGKLLEDESKGNSILSSFRWRILLSDENRDSGERESMRRVLKTWAKNGGKSNVGGGGSLGSLISPLMGMFSFASGGSRGKGEGGAGGGLGGLPGLGGGLDLGSLGLGNVGLDSLGLGGGLEGLGGGLGGLTSGLGGMFGGGEGGGTSGGLGGLPGGGLIGGMLGGGGGSSSSHRETHSSSSGGASGGGSSSGGLLGGLGGGGGLGGILGGGGGRGGGLGFSFG